jgi:hypothetical protein
VHCLFLSFHQFHRASRVRCFDYARYRTEWWPCSISFALSPVGIQNQTRFHWNRSSISMVGKSVFQLWSSFLSIIVHSSGEIPSPFRFGCCMSLLHLTFERDSQLLTLGECHFEPGMIRSAPGRQLSSDDKPFELTSITPATAYWPRHHNLGVKLSHQRGPPTWGLPTLPRPSA